MGEFWTGLEWMNAVNSASRLFSSETEVLRATRMIKAPFRRLQRGKILVTGLEAMHDI